MPACAGDSVQPDAKEVDSFGCLATTEIGSLNRIGSTVQGNSMADQGDNGTMCETAVDGGVKRTADFSCLCMFNHTADPLVSLDRPTAPVAPAFGSSLAG